MEEFRASRRMRGSEVTVITRYFPDKYVTISAEFSPQSLINHCDVHVSLMDDKGTTYKEVRKIQFHSDGKVVGYGFIDNEVKFRIIKRDRERFKSPHIALS